MRLPAFALLAAALAVLAPASAAIFVDETSPEAPGESGRALFEQRWVVAPSVLGQWGRGPTSNGEACTDCHAAYGRGMPPETAGEPMRSTVLRLSVPGAAGPVPHPAYGAQLQSQGILGRVPPEGAATIAWLPRLETLDDGTRVELRRPIVEVRGLAFGDLGAATSRSVRIAPPLAGAGILESIPEATLARLSGRDAGDGIRGRIHYLALPGRGDSVVGRFGAKATEPSLRRQIARALHEDLGVTSTLFPEPNCPPVQTACRRQPSLPQPEISDGQLDALARHIASLDAPARRPTTDPAVRRGEDLFDAINCSGCHVSYIEGLTKQPFSDLLLHDLGEGLADDAPADRAAGPRDWRTAPLWGLGEAVATAARLLHDGRARTVEEAILWHAGEASAARARYAGLPREDREALVRFLSTL